MSRLQYEIAGDEWAYCMMPISEDPVFGRLKIREGELSFETSGNLWKMGREDVEMIQVNECWFRAEAGQEALQLSLEPMIPRAPVAWE